MATSVTQPPASGKERGKRFVINVVWSWLGVGVSIIGGLLLSPYLIKKLGPEGYGIWTICFALVENYWFLDLGFRSATVKYVAHYWAREEYDKVSEVVNTGLAYAGGAALLMFFAVAFGARYLDRFFQVSSAYRESFFVLVLLVSFTWCINVVFSLFGACLEALQRFDLYNRIVVITTIIRVPGSLLLLFLGFGLIPIGILVVSSQLLAYTLHYYYFRQVYPDYHISFGGARMSMLRQMGRYGIHNFLGNISTQFLNQGPPLVIGHLLNAAFVGFFNIPVRLLMYTGEAVGRIGIITNSNTAELAAKGEVSVLSQLTGFINRYCVTIFMPLAILFYVYGTPFLQIYIPKAAPYSAPLLPILLTGYLAGIIGQFSSSMMLMGLARYEWYSRGLMAEAMCSIAGLLVVVPRYGILGAAWTVAIAMIINRGLFLPWLVSRVLHVGFFPFMQSIYARPVLAAIPPAALAVLLRGTVLPGRTWLQLGAASVLVGLLYYGLSYLFCLPPAHKQLLREWIGRKVLIIRSPRTADSTTTNV